MKDRIIVVMVALCGLMSVADIKAQGTVSPENEAFYKSLLPATDGTDLQFKERFRHRFSFHVNAIDWMLTMPGLGVEFDLNKKLVYDSSKKRTWKTNRTLLVFGKYNGNTKHTITPKYVYNVAGARIEFRKYWRTGKLGLNDTYHEDYRTMYLYKPDTLWREVEYEDEFGDTLVKREAYFSKEDSLRMARGEEYEGDPNRSRLANRYENARRIISTRTISNARNWRAYYIGAFAGVDRYSWCYGKKGEQGTLVALGAAFGYSIPVMASRPNGSGLDLDLGLNVGLPVVRYDGYKYVDNADYAFYARQGRTQADGWTVSPKYALRDVHVSLVYRFRSISRKVSLAIVDDYQKRIDEWNERQDKITKEKLAMKEEFERGRDEAERARKQQESAAFWDDWQRREYLLAMKELYPDRELQGQDSLDYIRLVVEKDASEYEYGKVRRSAKRPEKNGTRENLEQRKISKWRIFRKRK